MCTRFSLALFAIALVMSILGCGGGTGANTDPPNTENPPPAKAEIDFVISSPTGGVALGQAKNLTVEFFPGTAARSAKWKKTLVIAPDAKTVTYCITIESPVDPAESYTSMKIYEDANANGQLDNGENSQIWCTTAGGAYSLMAGKPSDANKTTDPVLLGKSSPTSNGVSLWYRNGTIKQEKVVFTVRP